MDGLLPWGVVDNPINACMDKIFMEIYQMNEQWRAEFEIDTPFVNPQPLCKNPINWLELKASGDYKFAHVQVAWRAYQAGRQAGVEEVEKWKKCASDNEQFWQFKRTELLSEIESLKAQLKTERECVDDIALMDSHAPFCRFPIDECSDQCMDQKHYNLKNITKLARETQSKRSEI